jgi:hypothetical protein
MFRWLFGLLLILALAAGVTYFVAGRGAPPRLTINKPDRPVGQAGALDVSAEAPNAKFTTLTIALEQNGKSVPLFALDASAGAASAAASKDASVTAVDRNQIRISRPLGKQSVPELQSGAARIVVTATRPSFLNLRTLTSTASKDFQVRLEAPRIAVLSTHHHINHGGAEMVVYRATPADVASGVRVGDVEYPGYPLSGDLKAAIFALLYDQDLNTRIQAFARDEAGNEAKATFIDNVFEKPQRKSRIELDDKFLNRVVPDILEHAPELKMTPPPEGSDMMPAFLRINGELRKINADQIAALAKKSSPTRQWEGPFVQLGNSKVEASFADHRTYFYKGKEVDRQVHLGFDLAVTAHVPVIAVRPSDVVRRQGRRPRDARADDWPQRFHRSRRRRSRPFHDAGRWARGQSGRVVGQEMDDGPGRAEASGSKVE